MMYIQKINPWNWFDHEDDQTKNLPALRGARQFYSPLTQLHNDLDRMFDSVLHGFDLPSVSMSRTRDQENAVLRPNIDVASTDKEYIITVEVPGVDEKDVKLELTGDGTLIIQGEKKHEQTHKDKNLHRVERSYGSFQRTLSLPEDASQENIQAAFKNGVLTVTVPRQAVTQTPTKRIEIKKAG
jgi:HSP20 family protein